MQDIRKPYTRSKSNHSRESILSAKVEDFEKNSYSDDEETEYVPPVHIPIKRIRRNIDDMDMYPRSKNIDEVDEEESEASYTRVNSDIAYKDNRGSRKNKNTFGSFSFIGVILVLVIGVGLLTYVFDSATVTITPKYNDMTDFRKAIVFSQDKTDTESVSIVVSSSSISKTKTLQLSESKTIQAKASGKITIYNNFDSNVQKLIKNTRFESSAGKIYRINQSITVPPKVGDTPGSIEVTVYADSYGSDYNVSSTNFTIPGFKGTARYGGFYAKSSGEISGGASGKVSVASLSDINAVKDELAIELKQELKSKLSEIKKEGYINMISALEIIYDDNQKELELGGSSEYKVTATGYLMFADSKQLAGMIAKDIRDYDNAPVDVTYADTLTFTRKDADHIYENKTLSVLVEGKPRIVWLNDENSIKNMLADKKRDEFKSVMKSISSIEGAEISFSPLWLSSFPDDVNKISIVESLPKR